jgi:hypothetical protein
MSQSADRIVAALTLPARKRDLDGVVPLPVADLGPLVDSGSVAFSLVRVGGNGTVAAQVALNQVGWAAGLPIRFTVSSGLIVVEPREKPVTASVSPRMSLTLPARLRARCRIRPGDQVLLASLCDYDLLVVYPQHALHEMVTAFHAELANSPDRTATE